SVQSVETPVVAARCGYGFDISSQYIEQARSLASKHHVEFYTTNVTALDSVFDSTCDIVFATASALCWTPDLLAYFAVAHRVLGTRGTLILYETHPFIEMFKTDVQRPANEKLVPCYSYNTCDPVAFMSEGGYFGDGDTGTTIYWDHHSLSRIVQSALDAEFTLRQVEEYQIEEYQIEEYEHDVCVGYRQVEQFNVRTP
ncbi:MAG: class I SAM-dependent methyltransferase, partial [Gammaproteobacteria bacterium]